MKKLFILLSVFFVSNISAQDYFIGDCFETTVFYCDEDLYVELASIVSSIKTGETSISFYGINDLTEFEQNIFTYFIQDELKNHKQLFRRECGKNVWYAKY